MGRRGSGAAYGVRQHSRNRQSSEPLPDTGTMRSRWTSATCMAIAARVNNAAMRVIRETSEPAFKAKLDALLAQTTAMPALGNAASELTHERPMEQGRRTQSERLA